MKLEGKVAIVAGGGQGDKKAESRGASPLLRGAPFGRGLGVSPRYNLSPLPGQEGGQGDGRKGFS